MVSSARLSVLLVALMGMPLVAVARSDRHIYSRTASVTSNDDPAILARQLKADQVRDASSSRMVYVRRDGPRTVLGRNKRTLQGQDDVDDVEDNPGEEKNVGGVFGIGSSGDDISSPRQFRHANVFQSTKAYNQFLEKSGDSLVVS